MTTKSRLVARLPIFYGWVIVSCMFLMLSVAHGVTLAGIPIFDELILEELGISRGTLKFRDFITIMCAGLSGPLIGLLADRYGARKVIFAGLLVLSMALYSYSYITSPIHIYLIHVLMGVCFAANNIVVVVILLSNWFEKKRGIALGLTVAGTSIGSALMPQLGAWLLMQMEWRLVLQVLACLPLVILPVIYVLAKETPEELGLRALGDETRKGDGQPPKSVDMTAVWAQMRSWRFFFLAAVALSLFYAANSFIGHAFLYLRDQGFEPRVAATGLSVIFAAGLIGKIASGFLVERWGVRPVWLSFQAMILAGAIFILALQSEGVWIGLASIGFGWGGAYSITQLTISNSFPRQTLGRLMGLFVIIEATGTGTGSWITGVFFDQQGSYTVAFLVAAGFMVISIISTRLFFSSSLTEPPGKH